MLRIKIIKGPNVGKTFDLTPGDHLVGRAPECTIVLSSPGISKNHARFSVQGTKCIVTDLGSSNGTYVNGAKIRDRILRPGDRIGFHDIIVELRLAHSDERSLHGSLQGGWSGNVAYQIPLPDPSLPPQGFAEPHLNQQSVQPEASTLLGLIETYVEKVVLPGVYKLAELYPVNHVIAALIAIFIILVTALATVPMAALTHQGIEKEAQRRALTIARQLSIMSEKAIANGSEANIRTDSAEAEDGVISALIVSQDDGHIIAPLSKAQSYSNDQFVASARKHENEPSYVGRISGSSIGVSVPIHGFSQELGQQVVLAEAIVVYKVDPQDWSATVGLFARILIIALVFGGLLFFFISRLVSHPITEATKQLDNALRGEADTVNVKFDFDIFKRLIDNVNSAISRMGKSAAMVQASSQVDRLAEASNLVRIITDPTLALDGEEKFLQVNSAFEELVGMRLLTLQGQDMSVLQDQALKLNLDDLIQKAKSQPGSIVTNQLEISGTNYELDMQSSPDNDDPQKFNYFICTIKRRGEA